MAIAAVLVIEDDPALCELLRSVLQDEGYGVVVADSLAGAAERLRTQPIDLVLADLVEFDRHGGPGTARAVRELAGERPVLLCTGQPGAEQLGAEAGLAGVLPKPFDLDVLLERVRGALENSSAPRPGDSS